MVGVVVTVAIASLFLFALFFTFRLCACFDDTASPAQRSSVRAVDASTGELRWQQRFHGRRDAQVAFHAVSNGIAVLHDRNGDLVALDAATGRERWRQPLAGGTAASAPVISGTIVVVLDGNRSLRAFDLATGALRWQVPNAVEGEAPHRRGPDLPSDLELDIRDSYGVAAISGMVIATGIGDNALRAFDPSSGSPVWRSPLRGLSASVPVVDTGTIVLRARDGTVHGFDVASGAERWARVPRRSDVFDAFVPTTTTTVASSAGTTTTVASGIGAPPPLSAADLSLADYLPPPLPAGPVVGLVEYDTNGSLGQSFLPTSTVFVDVATGAERWRTSSGVSASFAFDGTTVFEYADVSKELMARDAVTGTVEWKVDAPLDGELLAVGPNLYFAHHGSIEVLDPMSGVRRWEHPLVGPQATPVAVVDGLLLLT